MNRDSSFWYGIGYDLFKLDKTAQSVLVRLRLKDKSKAFFIDNQQRLWIGSENNTLYKMEHSGGQYYPKFIVSAPFGGVSVIAQGPGDILFISGTKGVFTFNVRTKAVQKLRNFDKMIVRSFYTTTDGTWITTYGHGFFLLSGHLRSSRSVSMVSSLSTHRIVPGAELTSQPFSLSGPYTTTPCRLSYSAQVSPGRREMYTRSPGR